MTDQPATEAGRALLSLMPDLILPGEAHSAIRAIEREGYAQGWQAAIERMRVADRILTALSIGPSGSVVDHTSCQCLNHMEARLLVTSPDWRAILDAAAEAQK